MSEKVSSALAAQLHAHALANASNEASVTSCQVQSVSASSASKDSTQPLQFETDAPAAAISAQLNFKIVPVESLGHGLGNSYQEMFASMNASQISNASTESSCSPPMAVAGAAAGAPPKPSRHMAVQPLNSVSRNQVKRSIRKAQLELLEWLVYFCRPFLTKIS